MLKSVLVLFFLTTLAFAQTLGEPDPPCERPLPPCIDKGCHCQFDWVGPEGRQDHWRLNDIVYGSYHDFDNWVPAPILFGYPCEVCFVTIRGAGTTFIDKDTKVNILTIGGNQWDYTNVFLGGANRNEDGEPVILTIGYDDVPEIKVVHGEQLCNGDTLLTITGKGFGFCAEDLTITVRDYTEDRDKWGVYDHGDCGYPYGCDSPGLPSILPIPGDFYNCENIRIYFLDQKIQCTVSVPDVFAQQFEVTVQLNIREPPLSDTVSWLTKYIK